MRKERTKAKHTQKKVASLALCTSTTILLFVCQQQFVFIKYSTQFPFKEKKIEKKENKTENHFSTLITTTTTTFCDTLLS